MFLLTLFAALSLALACLGIYAMLSYTVELRRHEIGVAWTWAHGLAMSSG